MSASNTGRCPWTVLGVQRSASLEQVREAYRKMAFKWHPDLNQEVADAHQRFQAVTEAFEEIKKRHAAGQGFGAGRMNVGARRGTPTYRYQAGGFQRDAGQNFSNFRRGPNMGGNYSASYQEEPGMYRRGRGTTHEGLHSMRSRVRAFEMYGTGLGFFVVAIVASITVMGVEVAWHSVNRGKSFEEVVREMQERPRKERYPERKRPTAPKSEGESPQ